MSEMLHEDDRSAAPYATNLLHGIDAARIRERLLAIPVTGHTRDSARLPVDEMQERLRALVGRM